MADRKITDLTALTTPASADVLPIVDVSEAAAADKNKKVTVGELFKGIPDGTAAAPAIAFESDDGNGFFLSTTDTIGIATNGVSRATVSTTAVTSTLPVIVPDGSAAAPSVAFTGSGTDTGLYSPGADQVAISTNGSERFRVNATGQVGIGGSPGTALDVIGAGTASTSIRARNDSTSVYLDANNGYSFLNTFSNHPFLIATNNTERLRITSAGLVGVGTSSPEQLIDVQGTTNPSIQVKSTGTASTDNARLRIAIGGTTANSEIYFADSAASAIGAIQYRHSDNRLSFTTNNDVRAVIDSSGRLGVGTTTPGTRLWVSESATGATNGSNDIAVFDRNAEGYIKVLSPNNAVGGIGFGDPDDNFIGAVRYDHASDNLNFFVNNSERARIDSSGRLGIGNSAPSKLLTIGTSSTANTTVRLNCSQTAGSDTAMYSFGIDDSTDFAGMRLDFTDRTTKGLQIFTASGFGYPISFSGSSGNQDVTIDTSGRLGIGTTSPVQKLEVAESDSTTVAIRASNSTGNFSLIRSSSSTNELRANDTAPIIFSHTAGTAERARIDSSGRLLVGTSTAYGSAVLQAVGYAGSPANTGYVSVIHGGNAGSGEDVGLLEFRDTRGAFGSIKLAVDGTTGTNDYPGRLVFSTTADGASSPTERMRITNGGNVAINCTGLTVDAPNVGGGIYTSTNGNIKIRVNGDGIQALQFYSQTGGTSAPVGSITVNAAGTSFNTSSDYRLKENVVAVTDGITRLQKLNPCRFNFIADPGRTVDGFLAHEVQDVVPEAIDGEKDGVNDNGNPIYQGIDQSKLVPLLTAALQEAVAKIESLEARLTAAGI